jgi:hypothetical protein
MVDTPTPHAEVARLLHDKFADLQEGETGEEYHSVALEYIANHYLP